VNLIEFEGFVRPIVGNKRALSAGIGWRGFPAFFVENTQSDKSLFFLRLGKLPKRRRSSGGMRSEQRCYDAEILSAAEHILDRLQMPAAVG
jgi:hypothetical protein